MQINIKLWCVAEKNLFWQMFSRLLHNRNLARAQTENRKSSFPKCAVPRLYLWLNCPVWNIFLVLFVFRSGERWPKWKMFKQNQKLFRSSRKMGKQFTTFFITMAPWKKFHAECNKTSIIHTISIKNEKRK